METDTAVLEFKCPCCNASLVFTGASQQMKCEYCDNTFDIDTLRACSESDTPDNDPDIVWDSVSEENWSEDDRSHIRTFLCDACGGVLITDDHTAATFCPYCGNAAILPDRLSDSLKPEGVIPFKTTKEDAKNAFLSLCKHKPLLPRCFLEQQHVEKITGIYVPFWLYDCNAELKGSYRGTRVHSWSDSRFIYTKTDHYLLRRHSGASYCRIPMDGSSKMEDAFMESIEPYDYNDLVSFEMAYLSGFLADKYDVESKAGEDRIRQRVETAMNDQLQSSFLGYASVIPASRQITIDHSKASYVLLPVWLLNTRYQGKTYTFAMNGQTGKMTGHFPSCPKKTAAWFCGIWAAAAALVSLIQMIF